MQTPKVLQEKLKISIVMAVFNGEHFIKQQLDSILSQTIIPDEIIICDDSHNDRTYKTIENTITQYAEIIVYYKNETRLGVSKNFEKAISLSSGDIIFLSDQDDVWKPDKIERLMALINTSPNYGGAFCNSKLVDKDLKSLGITHWDLRGFGFQRNEIKSYPLCGRLDFFLKRVPAAGHDMAFKAHFKDLILPFPNLEECHDTWIGLVIAATSKWAFTSDTLTKFRQHAGNLSQAGRGNQLKAAIDSIKNNICSWNMDIYDELINRVAQSASAEVIDLLKDRRNHSAARAEMNCHIFKRCPLIYKEITNKRYFKYGRGWKNVLQDLFLRGW